MQPHSESARLQPLASQKRLCPRSSERGPSALPRPPHPPDLGFRVQTAATSTCLNAPHLAAGCVGVGVGADAHIRVSRTLCSSTRVASGPRPFDLSAATPPCFALGTQRPRRTPHPARPTRTRTRSRFGLQPHDSNALALTSYVVAPAQLVDFTFPGAGSKTCLPPNLVLYRPWCAATPRRRSASKLDSAQTSQQPRTRVQRFQSLKDEGALL